MALNPQPIMLEESTVVNEEVTTPIEEGQGSGDPTPPEVPGSKTESVLLLKSLQEEKRKRRELEEKLTQLETPALSDEYQSDEAKALYKRIAGLESKISEITTHSVKQDLLATHPVLKDNWDKFEEFVADPEYAGVSLKAAAKVFMAEADLLERPRKGLEKSTGGPRVAPSTGITVEEIKDLREKDPKKYLDMLQKGQIKI